MQALNKLCAQPAFSITTTGLGVAGLCLAVKGAILTAAAATTVPVVMTVAGTCLLLSATWTLKTRILDRPLMQLRRNDENGAIPAVGANRPFSHPSAFRQIGDAISRVLTLQMVRLWDFQPGFPV